MRDPELSEALALLQLLLTREMSGKAAAANGKEKRSGQKPILLDYVGRRVSVITNEGRNVVGKMLGFDQVCNIILENSEERVFTTNCAVEQVSLGLFVIRGDNIAVVGEVDSEKDEKIPWQKTMVSIHYSPLAILSKPLLVDMQIPDCHFSSTFHLHLCIYYCYTITMLLQFIQIITGRSRQTSHSLTNFQDASGRLLLSA